MNIAQTKGEKKILLQFERFTETNLFKEEVQRIRKLLKLPKNGLVMTQEDTKKFSDISYVPTNFPTKPIIDGYPPMRTLNLESRKIIDLLPIHNIYLHLLVKNYIIFNKFFYDELTAQKEYFHIANVCELEDAQFEFEEYAPNDDPDSFFSIRSYTEMLEKKLWRYPVVLRIHPDASQRDIIEYIKSHWPLLKTYQEQYINRTKIGSFKNSKTAVNTINKERNDFIYENRRLPSREIAHLLAEKKMYLDVGHILKIISLEKAKREKK